MALAKIFLTSALKYSPAAFFACAILFPLLTVSPPAAAQNLPGATPRTGTISGKISDEKGQGVPGAVVLVLGAIRMGATSGPEGRFMVPNVPVGAYRVKVQVVGVAPQETRVEVKGDSTTSISITFELTRESRVDSLALFGTWRWASSVGGRLGANATPPPSGWRRLLQIHRDETYEFWEHDSVASYLLCRGKITIRPCRDVIEHTPTAWLCIELEGWLSELDRRQLVAFVGRDTIVTYPGGQGFGVSDALTHTYVRENTSSDFPRMSDPGSDRPFRLRNGLPGSYYVELSAQKWSLLGSFGRFYEWKDWQYPSSVRGSHRYAHDEIPSAAIADFDGDGIVDAAIHGSSEGFRENKVVCLLSNHGNWRPVLLLSEPTPFDTQDTTRFREPHTTLFLRLLHAGEKIRDLKGNAVSFPTNAILVARPDGYAVPFHLERGELVAGPRVESARWNPRDPR